MATYNGLPSNYTYYRYMGTSYEQAVKAKTAALTSISRQSQNVNQMIEFIGQVAINEQQKELDSIQNYCKKMKEDFPFAKNLLDPDYIKNKPDDFQSQLIIAFDSARQGMENTKKAIERLYRNSGLQPDGTIDLSKQKNFNEYMQTDYLIKLAGDMESFHKYITEQQVSEKINPSSLTQKMNKIVSDVLVSSGIISKLQSGADVEAVGQMIKVDLAEKVQNLLDSNIEFKTFDDISGPIIDKLGEQYLEELRTRSPSSEIQNLLLKNFDDPQFALSLDNIKTILNLTGDPTKIINKEVQEATEEIKNIDKEDEAALRASFNNLQKEIAKNPNLSQSLFQVNFSISGSGKSKHGNIYELVKGLIKGGKVESNVAVDLVTYHFDYKVEKNPQAIVDYTRQMTDALSSIGTYLTKNKSTDRRGFMKAIQRAEATLRELNQKLEDELNKLDEFKGKKTFIQYETLKLSTSAEKGVNINGKTGFHGRSMNITTYLGYLASMSSAMGANSDMHLNMPELEFLAYNILPGAAADDEGQTQTALANYLSIFAAMMMFDDVGNMATEALQQVQSLTSNGQVEVLHIYNLNGMMVPASVVLSRVYDSLQASAECINTGSAIQASIFIEGKRKSINDVKVSITFMSDFINTIQSLYSAIS